MNTCKDLKCSRIQVEQYLLNQMGTEEEIAFQKHLKICKKCNSHLNSIRTLSGFIGDESLQNITRTESKKETKTLKLIYRKVSIAASILLIVGTSFFFWRNNNANIHQLQINEQHRASTEQFQIKILSPEESISTLNINEKVLEFKWDKNVYFELLIKSGNDTIISVNGTGYNCLPEMKIVSQFEQLDWILTIDGRATNGRIFIVKK